MSQTPQKTGKKRKYTIIFEPAEEGGYVVSVPYLGIATQGETLEEGRAMALDAITLHLECLAEDGLPIPEEPAELDQQVFVEQLDIQL
jgi:antitoxin HicB